MLFLASKKFSLPDEKIPALTKTSHPPSPFWQGRFLPTLLMLFGKLWHASPFQHEA